MIERDFYPLPMLAARWGCTAHDLLHLGGQDRAQVCVNIYGLATGTTRTRLHGDEDEAEDEPLTEQEQQEADAHDAKVQRWMERTTRDMPHGIFELTTETLRFLEMPDAFPHELFEALKFDHGAWWAVDFDPPVSIKPEHLCMLSEEVARLDRVRKPAQLEREADAARGDAPVLARAAQDWPDGLKAMAARPLLTLREAACLLAGIVPGTPFDALSEQRLADVDMWEATLARSVEAGELPRLTCLNERGSERPAIRPADLAAWCTRVPGGLAYPLLGLQVPPATDPALREALAAQVTHLQSERDKVQQEQDVQQQQPGLPAIFAGVAPPRDLVPIIGATQLLADRTGVTYTFAHEALETAIIRNDVPIFLIETGCRPEQLDQQSRADALRYAWEHGAGEAPEDDHDQYDRDALCIDAADLRRLVPELADEIINALQPRAQEKAQLEREAKAEAKVVRELLTAERARGLVAELEAVKDVHAQALQELQVLKQEAAEQKAQIKELVRSRREAELRALDAKDLAEEQADELVTLRIDLNRAKQELQQAHDELAKLQQGQQAQASSTRPEGDRRSGEDRRKGWPWGTHETGRLRLLAEAAKQFWSTYDPADSTTAPINEHVIAWLMKERGLTKRAAEAMATILRADGLPPGPRV
jgi:hypothetical protein